MEQKLRHLIQESSKILITSHIGPDGDSVSSALLLYKILKLNYPEKKIVASIEEKPYGLNFLDGIDSLQISPLADALTSLDADLLIILDSNTIPRVTRDPVSARNYLTKAGPKVIIIDHHEPMGVEQNDLYINNSSPAVTFDIFELFIEKIGLRRPEGYAQIALTGIYTDTGGFVHRNLNYKKIFETVPKLIEDGADIEKVANSVNRISEKGFEFFKAFINNLAAEKGYAYAFLPDDLLTGESQVVIEAVKESSDIIRSSFLRNIDGIAWGFIVYRDLLSPVRTYSVSFRALSDGKDVSAIAAKLGGGGHKPAAGAKVAADNVQEAIDKVKKAISDS